MLDHDSPRFNIEGLLTAVTEATLSEDPFGLSIKSLHARRKAIQHKALAGGISTHAKATAAAKASAAEARILGVAAAEAAEAAEVAEARRVHRSLMVSAGRPRSAASLKAAADQAGGAYATMEEIKARLKAKPQRTASPRNSKPPAALPSMAQGSGLKRPPFYTVLHQGPHNKATSTTKPSVAVNTTKPPTVFATPKPPLLSATTSATSKLLSATTKSFPAFSARRGSSKHDSVTAHQAFTSWWIKWVPSRTASPQPSPAPASPGPASPGPAVVDLTTEMIAERICDAVICEAELAEIAQVTASPPPPPLKVKAPPPPPPMKGAAPPLPPPMKANAPPPPPPMKVKAPPLPPPIKVQAPPPPPPVKVQAPPPPPPMKVHAPPAPPMMADICALIGSKLLPHDTPNQPDTLEAPTGRTLLAELHDTLDKLEHFGGRRRACVGRGEPQRDQPDQLNTLGQPDQPDQLDQPDTLDQLFELEELLTLDQRLDGMRASRHLASELIEAAALRSQAMQVEAAKLRTQLEATKATKAAAKAATVLHQGPHNKATSTTKPSVASTTTKPPTAFANTKPSSAAAKGATMEELKALVKAKPQLVLDVLLEAPPQRELLNTTPLQKPKLIGELQKPTEPIEPLPEVGDLVLTLGEEDSVLVAVMASIIGDGGESVFSSPPASLYGVPNDLASEADLDAELKRLDDLEGWEVVEGWNLPAARDV